MKTSDFYQGFALLFVRKSMQSSNLNEVYVGKNVSADHVKRLKLSGVHNCCGPCCDAIQGAIESMAGVVSDTAEPGESSFEVMGDFSPAELIEALHGAGFHAEIVR